MLEVVKQAWEAHLVCVAVFGTFARSKEAFFGIEYAAKMFCDNGIW